MSKEFEIKDLGEAKKILGMEILRHTSKNELYLTQTAYLHKVLARFDMLNRKQVITLLPNTLDYQISNHCK